VIRVATRSNKASDLLIALTLVEFDL
jgi:hypothetical protein